MTLPEDDRTFRVLIIDIDSVRRGMLACTLPAARFSLEFARSVEKGLELLGQFRPDVVIVGRDAGAQDVCQRVRSLGAGAGCTLLLMDERYRNESLGEAEADAAGADAFLPFPFEGSLLLRRLRARRQPPAAEASGSAQRPTSGTRPSRPAATPVSPLESTRLAWEGLRARVQSFYDQRDGLDYYQLLEIPRQAGPAEIKDAYFTKSMELHPDRFMLLEDEELRRKIYEVYKRITEGFKVLINPEIRSQYDAGLHEAEPVRRFLDRGRPLTSFDDPAADASTPAGKRYLHFATLAESEGNLRSARMYLTLALQCEPQNDALRRRLEVVTRRLDRAPGER